VKRGLDASVYLSIKNFVREIDRLKKYYKIKKRKQFCGWKIKVGLIT